MSYVLLLKANYINTKNGLFLLLFLNESSVLQLKPFKGIMKTYSLLPWGFSLFLSFAEQMRNHLIDLKYALLPKILCLLSKTHEALTHISLGKTGNFKEKRQDFQMCKSLIVG